MIGTLIDLNAIVINRSYLSKSLGNERTLMCFLTSIFTLYRYSKVSNCFFFYTSTAVNYIMEASVKFNSVELFYTVQRSQAIRYLLNTNCYPIHKWLTTEAIVDYKLNKILTSFGLYPVINKYKKHKDTLTDCEIGAIKECAIQLIADHEEAKKYVHECLKQMEIAF